MPIYAYSQKSNATKKETFNFIVYQCKFLHHPGYEPKQYLEGAKYENLTIQVIDEVPSNFFYSKIKSTLNLNDISEVKFKEDNRDSEYISYEVTVYFILPYPTVSYQRKGGQFESTNSYETFYFSSKIEARKMYKALIHMQSLVSVNKQLFSGD